MSTRRTWPASALSLAAFLAVSFFAGAAIMLIVMPLLEGMVVYGMGRRYLGEEATPRECVRAMRRRWPTLIGATLVYVLFAYAGAMACLVPGILVILYGYLYMPPIMLENARFPDCLMRSYRLVRHNEGRALALIVIFQVIAGFGPGAVAMTGIPYLSEITGYAMGMVAAAFAACVWVVFYFSLRAQRENLDLELMTRAIESEVAEAESVL